MLTIAWDVDDVLNDLTRLWLAQAWTPGHPAAPVYETLTENPPHGVLGVSREEYLSSLDEFRHTSACIEQPPMRDVHEWFVETGHTCRHVALTAVPLHAADLSAAWLLRHYGTWIRSFNFVPSPRPDDPPTLPACDKADWLSWSNIADVFVDDSQSNVEAARRVGVAALLFPRPWNADADRPVADVLYELTGLARAGMKRTRPRPSPRRQV